jgi:sulfur relay (sulfurtransferase) DsrF/TusC family protein
MKGKKITLIFENTPFADEKTYEGLRMGLGLTISNDNISFVFMNNAQNVLRVSAQPSGNLPDVGKAIQMFIELKKNLYVLKDNKTEKIKFAYPVIFINKKELFDLIRDSEIVIRC